MKEGKKKKKKEEEKRSTLQSAIQRRSKLGRAKQRPAKDASVPGAEVVSHPKRGASKIWQTKRICPPAGFRKKTGAETGKDQQGIRGREVKDARRQ